MPPENKRQGVRRWRAGVIAGSLAAHVLVVGALLLSLPPRQPLPEPPVIDVQMLPPPLEPPPELPDPPVEPVFRAPRPTSSPQEPPRPSPIAPVRILPPAAPPAATGPIAPTPAPTASPGPAAPAAQPGVDRVREGLRLSVGCENADVLAMTRREREACDEARGARNRGEPDLGRSRAERQRDDARAVARNPRPRGPAHVRGPNDNPQNHAVIGQPPVMVGATIPFGKPPKAIEPIAPSTLRGDDDALRPKPAPRTAPQ